MVLVYLGKNQRLRELVERHKPVINRSLQKVFGLSYFTLESDVEALLTPESFYDSVERFEELSGRSLRKVGTCKIEFGTDLDFRKDEGGRLKAQRCRVGYGFHVLDDPNQDISKRVFSSYIHNYCRFLISLTQNIPMYLAMAALDEGTPQHEKGYDFMMYAEGLNQSPKTLNEKIRLIQMKNASNNLDMLF